MAKVQQIFLASVFAVVFLVQIGSAIECFECNSHLNPECALDVPPKALLKQCGEHKHGVAYTFCRKITQVIEFSVNNLPPDSRVIRGCGWDDSSYKNKCYQRSGFGGRLEVCACDEDGCNGAVSIKNISLTFGLLMAAIVTLFSRL